MRRAIPLLLCLLACTPERRGGEGERVRPDAGAASCSEDADCGLHGSCDRATGSCGCKAGLHPCGGQCLSDDAPASCGDRCSPCPLPEDGRGRATCMDRTCGISCDEGQIFCGGHCITCAGACVDGACRSDCATRTHRCGNRCVSDTDPSACGAGCTACVPPTNSGLVASCEEGGCAFACPAGQTLCRGRCASGPCAWTETVLQAVGDAPQIAIDSAGAVHLAWTSGSSSTWGHHLVLGSGAQSDSLGLCAASEPVGLGFTARGTAVLCAQGNYQLPMQLFESGGGAWQESELSRTVTGARSLRVGGDVATWISDSSLWVATFQNGAWTKRSIRRVPYEYVRLTSLLFDASHRPRLAFTEFGATGGPHAVVLSRDAGGTWRERNAGGSLPTDAQYVLLPDDTVAAAWVQYSEALQATMLLYATERSGFLAETVASGLGGADSNEGLFDVALDASGAPRIALLTKTGVKMATRAGGQWLVEDVATGSYRSVKLALDASGSPVIVGAPWAQQPLRVWR